MSTAEPEDGGEEGGAGYEVYDGGNIDKDDYQKIKQTNGVKIGVSSSGSGLKETDWEEGAEGVLQASYDDVEESDAKGILHDVGGGEAQDEQVQFETMRERDRDGLDVEIFVPEEQTEDLDIDAEAEETGVEVNRSWMEKDDGFDGQQQVAETEVETQGQPALQTEAGKRVAEAERSGEQIEKEEIQDVANARDFEKKAGVKTAKKWEPGTLNNIFAASLAVPKAAGDYISGKLGDDPSVSFEPERDPDKNLAPHLEETKSPGSEQQSTRQQTAGDNTQVTQSEL